MRKLSKEQFKESMEQIEDQSIVEELTKLYDLPKEYDETLMKSIDEQIR